MKENGITTNLAGPQRGHARSPENRPGAGRQAKLIQPVESAPSGVRYTTVRRSKPAPTPTPPAETRQPAAAAGHDAGGDEPAAGPLQLAETAAAPGLTNAFDFVCDALRTIESGPYRELLRAARRQGHTADDLNTAVRRLLGFRPPVPPPAPAPFDPVAAGERQVRELQTAEGGAWTGAELETRFGLSPATLHKRRKENRMVYWRDARHSFHYPKWQFTPTGALWPGLGEVLAAFQSTDEWRVVRYFLGERAQLDGRRPLDLLRQGEVARVVAHAQLHAAENTW